MLLYICSYHDKIQKTFLRKEKDRRYIRIDILLCGEVGRVTARVDGILALVYSDIIYQHGRRESKVCCVDITESF